MNNKNENNAREQEKKDRKLDNLINIVEKHTRTERHLEQYSHIGSHENKENAREKQELREKQINELKEQLSGSDKKGFTPEEQIENLKENYQFGEGYIESNKEHMNPEDLQNLETKQENRKIQMENLENNINKNND